MSWQAYVDTNMVGTGHVSKGAILGLDGTVWAKSPDFNISAPEAQHIAQNISNPGALQGSGARVEEEKHFCVRADGSFAYTKKGDSGMCIVKCKQYEELEDDHIGLLRTKCRLCGHAVGDREYSCSSFSEGFSNIFGIS